jgi:type IV secretory pathway TrbL component
MMTVRSLAIRTPAAVAGDATGAALQAHDMYSTALKNAGGNHAKAVAMLQQASKPPEPAPTNTPAQNPQTKPRPPAVEKPAYVPPADSPAGKAAANRAAQEFQSMQKIQATKDAALAAIQSGDPAAADAVRGMPGFMSLPREQKAQIQKIIFGR